MDNKQLDQLIQSAAKKIGAKKENDICRFLPSSTGGYIHHFTMRKMKTEDPKQLAELLTKHIIETNHPQEVAPKPRAARGSRKRRDLFVFSKDDLKRMLDMAHKANDREMIRKLTPKKDPRTIKRELISSIRHGRVESDLWNMYVESTTTQSNVASAYSTLATANV